MSDINSKVVGLMPALGSVQIGESGVAVFENAKTVAVDTLPAGMDKASLKQLQEHRDNLVAASTLALKDAGFDYLKKNPGVPEVTMKLPYGTDTIAVRIKREKDVRNVQTGEVSKVYGSVGVAYKASTRPNRGELKKVCQAIRDQFASLAD